jgi:hypothetical protein
MYFACTTKLLASFGDHAPNFVHEFPGNSAAKQFAEKSSTRKKAILRR